MLNFFIGLLIGGITGGLIILLTSKDKQEIKLLKTQNKILSSEKEERMFIILQNQSDIKSLVEKDNELELQILHCHEWLTKLTKIKSEVELHTNIVATRRFREAHKLSENDTYISE